MKMEYTANCHTDLSVANSPQTPQRYSGLACASERFRFFSLACPDTGKAKRAPEQGATNNYDAFYQFFA
jgi:hypothetical protein